MARLTVSLFGPLEVRLDDKAVTDFATGKARALLAYLVVEANRHPKGHLRRPHRREVLAGLLWPDYPERSARTNLRNTLSNLRKAIGDRDADAVVPFLLVTRETIQFNAESDCWVDVWAFSELEQAGGTESHHLEEAIALYRGPFLEGFSVADSPAFEDWALVVRERLERQALEALQSLTAYHEGRDEYARAREYARRRIELAPWQEQAQRDLMRLLAISGQRGVALAQDRLPEAISHARALLDPAQQHLPGSMTVVLEEAIAAWERDETQATRACLGRVLTLAQELGYL